MNDESFEELKKVAQAEARESNAWNTLKDIISKVLTEAGSITKILPPVVVDLVIRAYLAWAKENKLTTLPDPSELGGKVPISGFLSSFDDDDDESEFDEEFSDMLVFDQSPSSYLMKRRARMVEGMLPVKEQPVTAQQQQLNYYANLADEGYAKAMANMAAKKAIVTAPTTMKPKTSYPTKSSATKSKSKTYTPAQKKLMERRAAQVRSYAERDLAKDPASRRELSAAFVTDLYGKQFDMSYFE